jgi:hypothetical protein
MLSARGFEKKSEALNIDKHLPIMSARKHLNLDSGLAMRKCLLET